MKTNTIIEKQYVVIRVGQISPFLLSSCEMLWHISSKPNWLLIWVSYFLIQLKNKDNLLINEKHFCTLSIKIIIDVPSRAWFDVTRRHTRGCFFLDVTHFILGNGSSLIIHAHRPSHHLSSPTRRRTMRKRGFHPVIEGMTLLVFARFSFCISILFVIIDLRTLTTGINSLGRANLQIAPNPLFMILKYV